MDAKELIKYMQSWVNKDLDGIKKEFQIKPRIFCVDGFSISVQAHDGAYCSPRVWLADWDTVECGFPSDVPDQIMHAAEDKDDPTGTVYGYVDVGEVAALLSAHGGIDYEKSPIGPFA